jgi:hypothetical protein
VNHNYHFPAWVMCAGLTDLDQPDAPSILVPRKSRYVRATRPPISGGIEPVKCTRVVRGLESHRNL